MNPQLIRAIARASQQDSEADLRAGRRAARLRADPLRAAQLVRSILAREAPVASRGRRAGSDAD
jgi:hypothetical protein